MLHWRNNFTFILLCAMLYVSCGLIDLRPISYSVEPKEPYSILNDPCSPVIVKFDTEMKKSNTEGILQISSDLGIMSGDLSWIDNDLYFRPVPEWTAGIKYTLSLLGTIQSVDGRELRIEHFIPFYAINRNNPPMLEEHTPANGASVNTDDNIFEFHFSQSMDRLTTESALTIEGTGNKTFEWSDNGKVLKVIADKALIPWTYYRWNLKDSAKSVDGVPLPKSYSGYFTTDFDQSLPQVVSVFPVLNSDGCWYPTGADIETSLGSGQGIAVEFNKPMGGNVLRSLRFEPSLTGRTEMLSENSIVYIFTKDPEPETTYTMIVSADTRDKEGLKTGTEYRVNFTPDIPFLKVLSFSAGGTVTQNIYSNIVLPVNINRGTGEMFFSIRFSTPLSMEEKQNAAAKIILSSFFPRTLSPVALQYVNWISDDRLYMCWEGLKHSDRESVHYYKLTIPGGKGGINNGTGIYMKEDLTILLEAVNEF